MLILLIAPLYSGLQLHQNFSNPIQIFAGIMLKSPVQFHQSQTVVSNWFWQLNSLQMCIRHPRTNTLLLEDRLVDCISVFYYNSSSAVGVKHNREGSWYPNGGSLTLRLPVWLLLTPSQPWPPRCMPSKWEAMWHLPAALETLPECKLVGKRTNYLIFWVWQVMVMVLVYYLLVGWRRFQPHLIS